LTAAFHASSSDPVSHHAAAVVRQATVPQITIHDADDVALAAACAAAFAAGDQSAGDAAHAQECQAQSDFLRCIFGNPFLPVQIDPAWLKWNGSTVLQLAKSIYEDRAFDRMPLLGDALEATAPAPA
jgi:hypothetical protein